MRRLSIISGGGTGIGFAVAEALAEDGDVVILGRRAGVLATAAKQINDRHDAGRVRALPADLRDPGAVQEAVSGIVSGDRKVDVLVNNAGGNYAPHPATDLDEVQAQYLENFTGNVLPVVLLTEALLPHMRRPGARVITVTSIAALRGNASYGAAKGALHPWSASLAVRLAPDGITVNTVAPGYVSDTEFYGERMNPRFHEERSQWSPLGRGGEPAEIAGLVRYLAGADAGFVTGQIVQINGGALLGRG